MKHSDDDKSNHSEDDKLKAEGMDTYPVDETANYAIIAQHFQSGVTRNSNIEHSIVDLDDLPSIRLNDDSEYADSQMSLGSAAKSQQSSTLNLPLKLRNTLSNARSTTSNFSAVSNSSSGSLSSYDDESSYNKPRKAKRTKMNGLKIKAKNKPNQSGGQGWSADEDSDDGREKRQKKRDSGSDTSDSDNDKTPKNGKKKLVKRV